MTIYLRKPSNADQCPQLLTYAWNIREMSEDGLNWKLYDERFRFERAQFQEKPRWGAIRQDIYNRLLNEKYCRMLAQQNNAPSQQPPSTGGDGDGMPMQIPKAYCFSYHT